MKFVNDGAGAPEKPVYCEVCMQEGDAVELCAFHAATPELVTGILNAIETMQWALDKKMPQPGSTDWCVMACQDLRDSLRERLEFIQRRLPKASG